MAGELTNRSFLMLGSGSSPVTYAKLVDILDYPNIGGAPEMIDVTTLSDMERHYIDGIDEQEAMVFNALYDGTDYETLKALEGNENPYAIYFGGTDSDTPTGSEGKFMFTGRLRVYVTGDGINAARKMAITIAPTSAITFDI